MREVVSVVPVQIPNGGLHDMVLYAYATAYEGTLHGEDADTGAPWHMPFWLPAHIVFAWRASPASREPDAGAPARPGRLAGGESGRANKGVPHAPF